MFYPQISLILTKHFVLSQPDALLLELEVALPPQLRVNSAFESACLYRMVRFVLQPDAPLLELEDALPPALRSDSVPPIDAGMVAGLPLVRA